MTLKDMDVEIAPGVKYNTWAFDGHGAPGPVVHVREGQTVEMTLTNGGAIPHSIDFHAARIAPNMAFRDVAPGRVVHLPFQGERSGRLHVPLWHEAGARAHRERDVRRDRRRTREAAAEGRQRVRARRERVVPERRRDHEPASLDMAKARAMSPDWTTFNGYANQYVTHPLTADPGETTRFYVVAAGPTLDTNFHVVGTIFDRAWVNGDMTSSTAARRPDGRSCPPAAAASSTSRSTTKASTPSSAMPSRTSTSARSAC